MFSQGEVRALEKLPEVQTASFGQSRWMVGGAADAEAAEQAGKALETSIKVITGGEYDLVILDEINSAVDFGLVPLEDVLALVSARPKSVDLILTGRHADDRLIQAADVVTEMVNVKHAFERGILAREGIDY